MLKRVIDGLVTVVTLVAAVGVVYVIAIRVGWLKDPQSRAPTQVTRYATGDTMDPLEGVDYSGAKKTVLVVFTSNCKYCIQGASFYQRLVTTRNERARDVRIIAVALAGDTNAAKFPEMQGWSPDRLVVAKKGQLKLLGVPSLMVVDSQGKVTATWLGELSEAEKQDVVDASFGAA
jgi:hypothetical protein